MDTPSSPQLTSPAFLAFMDWIKLMEQETSFDLAGGQTKWGIAQNYHPNIPDVMALTYEQCVQIYFQEYWSAMRAGEFAWPVSIILADSAVHQGPGTAVKLLQETLGIAADGIVGPLTLLRVNRSADVSWLKIMLLGRRAGSYGMKYAFQNRLFRLLDYIHTVVPHA